MQQYQNKTDLGPADIRRARKRCVEWHAGQTRKGSGLPYSVHPMAVAERLKSLGFGPEVEIAALLHDVIEDCGITAEQIQQEFGVRVAELVVMVSDVSRPEDGNRKIRKALDRDHLATADADGQSIKVADLLDNTSSILKDLPGFAPVYMREKRLLLEVLGKADPRLLAEARQWLEDYFPDD